MSERTILDLLNDKLQADKVKSNKRCDAAQAELNAAKSESCQIHAEISDIIRIRKFCEKYSLRLVVVNTPD